MVLSSHGACGGWRWLSPVKVEKCKREIGLDACSSHWRPRGAEAVHASLSLVMRDGFILRHSVETRVRVGPGEHSKGGIKDAVECPLFVDPPYISEAKGTGVPVGQKGTLQCEASAVPSAEFQWYKDDKR